MPKSKKKNKKPHTPARFTPTSWGAGGGGDTEELTVPSGQLVLVRTPGVQGLLHAGVLERVDSVTALVAKHLGPDGRVSADETTGLASDSEAVAEMLRLMERVVCHIVLEPHIEPAPSDVTRRQDGVIYSDTISLADRAFLFNYAVAGVRDAESFRRSAEALVGTVAAEQRLGDAAGSAGRGDGSGGGVVPEPGSAPVRSQRRSGARAGGAGGTKSGTRATRTPAGASPSA